MGRLRWSLRIAATGMLAGTLAATVACGGMSGGSGDLGVWTPGGAPAIIDAGGAVGASSSAAASAGGGSSSSGAGGGGGGSAASGGSSTTGAASGGAGGLPCDVASVLAAKCTSCHSDPPINNALSGLVTYADLTATAKEDATRNEAQLSVVRMQNTASPMPPTSVSVTATAADVATLQNWINAGYPTGSCGSDAGSDSGPGPSPSNVFTGQPAFRSQTGPNSHNAGQDCMGCHANGNGEAPRFSFAGTLYDGHGQPVAGAEVRVVDKNGVGASAYTGSNGNFYRQGTPIATPGQAGARNASATAAMISAVTAPGCSSCHCSGSSCATTQMHLP
jgi:hypothetical protein